MDDARLITMVRQHQELYDIDAPDYCNQDVRLRIWEIIGTKLGVTAKRCKTRWSYLRDLYTKALKNRSAKRVEGSTAMKPWKYEAEMGFLNQFLGSKQKLNPYIVGKRRKLHRPIEAAPVEEIGTDNNVKPVSPPSTPLNCPSPSSSIQNSAGALRRLHVIAPQTFVQDHGHHHMAPPNDALTKYFVAVEETVRGFPAALQVKVKSEISRIIHQAEMENIQQSQFEPFLQTTPDMPQLQFSVDNQGHAQYPFECAVTKQEQPG